MKKNTKIIIAMSSVIVVLGVVLGVILAQPSENSSENANENTDILLFDKSSLDVDDVTIKNADGEYQILGYKYSEEAKADENEEISMFYTMQGYENTLMSKYMTDNLVKECQIVAATRLIDKSGKKYSDYGLDKPSVEVKVIYSDSSKVNMYFGNEAPDKSGVYCRIDGNKNVYLVNSASVDMFFIDKLQLFDKTLTGELSDSENITLVEISGKGYEKPIIISREKNGIINSVYAMSSPFMEECDSSKTVDFAATFYSFTLSNVAAAEVKADDIEKFGLAEPYMDIKISTDEGNNINILVSEQDSEGNCYIMNKDGNIIYKADEDEFKYYNETYRGFLGSSVYSPDIANADLAEIFYEDKVYNYSIKREHQLNDLYEENIVTYMYYNETAVDYTNLLRFVSSLSNAERTEEIPENLNGYEKIFYIKLTFGETDYMLELYRNKENKTVAVVDGNIECVVDTEFVQKIIEQTEKISLPDGSVETIEIET